MNAVLVSRAQCYSPSREQADDAILKAAGRALERCDCSVTLIAEEDLAPDKIPASTDIILQMTRGDRAFEILSSLDIPMINSTAAVMNCRRAAQTRLMLSQRQETGQDYSCGLIPESVVTATSGCGIPSGWNSYPCWVKRGDSHAMTRDDVSLAQNPAECLALMQRLAGRGVGECVLQRHEPGYLVKFYGVRGHGLISATAVRASDGKFGLEGFNDPAPDGMPVPYADIERAAVIASDIIGADVFGGDAIVGPEGRVKIIDFNDWPSFSSCREKAAEAIAELAISRLKR